MKRGKRALILAGVLAALVLVYAGVQKSVSQPETVTEESGTYALTAHTAEELTGLQWTNGDGEEQETLHFIKTGEEEQWQADGDETFPVEQDSVEKLAETLIALEADRKLENVENPGDYGLAEPAFSLAGGSSLCKKGKKKWQKNPSLAVEKTVFFLHFTDKSAIIYPITHLCRFARLCFALRRSDRAEATQRVDTTRRNPKWQLFP